MENEAIRLNKYLSEAGICSRREADRLILEGKVTVDGVLAKTGQKVLPGQKVVCTGRTPERAADHRELTSSWNHKPPRVLLAVNKPRGVVCTTSHKDRAPNIVDMVEYPVRVYPMGRLDKDSEGLILLTNQGDLVNQMMRGASGHEKEYEVTVNRPITGDFLRNMEKGVYLRELKVKTRPCQIKKTGEKSFRIILTQGLNRQIRRMCGELGFQVVTLKRVRIMNICLNDLKPGTYRAVTQNEWNELNSLLKEPKTNQ